MSHILPEEQMQWFVMRDLKRANAKLPAYKLLSDKNFEVFVPMKWQLVNKKGVKERREIPAIPDLLFVHSTRKDLDPVVAKTGTLQYRFLRNCNRAPMTVRNDEMERFMFAVNTSDSPKYYLPDEITPGMYGRKIRIVGGPLNGYEGSLITSRGSKTKRILIELQDFFAVSVEVTSEYIQFV